MIKIINNRDNLINKGFSLVELLIVIAIIGILSSLVLVGLKIARVKADQAKVAQTLHSLQIAMELYKQDHGYWPESDDGRMVIDNRTGAAWNSFTNKILPYMPGFKIDLPYQLSEDEVFMMQGFIYLNGTEDDPVQISMYNSKTGQYVGCVKIYEGYLFDYVFNSSQSSFTLKDNGIDPDGIDHVEGHYTIDGTPAAQCVATSIVY